MSDKLAEELEIVSLLKKIREMYGMLKYAGISDFSRLHKYNNNAIVHITSSDEGSGSESKEDSDQSNSDSNDD